jgi:RHS repeat-associated protein
MTLLPCVFTLTNLGEMLRSGETRRKNEKALLPITNCSLITFIAATTFFIGGGLYASRYFYSVFFSPNSPPVAVNDSYTLHGYITVQGPGIVANDHDPEGGSLSLASCSTAAHGTVNCATQYKSFTYEPNFGYVGSDSFTYQVCDNLGACSTGTVNLTINNTAPVAVADFFIWQGSLIVPGNMALRENDYDAENDPRSVISYTQPAHGSANYSFSVGSLSYAPNAGFTGLDTFTYVLRDNLGLSSTATVYILVLPGAGPNAKAAYACCPTDPGFLSQFFPQVGGLAGGTGGVAGASGPSWPDPVNLATGRETYAHAPDLEIYNPTGPAVAWQRHYSGQQALTGIAGYGSPGLSRGWTHNYDVYVQAVSGSWGAVTLNYPNGSKETLTPQLSGGNPTGNFTTVAGAPYLVTGVAGSPTGTWQSITVTWKDQTKWKFTQLSGTTYALNQVTNRTGQSLNFTWNSTRRLTQVSDAGTSSVLLALAYDSFGRLATATDIYSRQVTYSFSADSGTAAASLQTVSHVVASGTPSPAARWSYTYNSTSGFQLNTVTVPSPTGSGNSTATINYDSIGRVSSLVDANGNQRIYTYNTGNTQVQVKDSANNTALSWTQKFNTNLLNTGITDAANHSTTVANTDSANPLKPTSVTNRNSQVTSYTYDSFGNVLTVTTPRVTTTYTWSYTNFALGRLTSIQQGTKPATTITYYEPSGLVNTITRPVPNNGAGTTTTTYTYDSLGNLLTVVAPGNNATSTITTTLNYTIDGAYSQTAKIGQPLTITDNLSHVTHLRYDSQGRTASVTDPIGNETSFSYNLLGQLLTTAYPATGQTGSGNSHVTNAYLYVGGPLTSTTFYDENNTQVRQVTHSYGLEGESLTVGGSTEPVTNTFDALYRLKTLKDGNNNTTTYAYNNVGLVSSITMPGSDVTQFTSYDNEGNLLQRIDGNGVTTNYVYNDPESLLTDIEYPATTSLNVHFTYDSYGRRSGMTDSTGSQSYSYGNLDELLSATTTYTGLAAKTISYSYYPNGSRESMTTPAGRFDYSHDAAGRPASMTNPFSETTTWSHLNNDWLDTQTLDNGAVADYTYNALGQVTRLLNQIGSTTISDFTSITYDGVGNRKSVTASIPGAASLNGTTDYAYDSKNQLTQEASTRNGGFTDNFAYDSAGNPVTFKGVSNSFNSNNQQTGTGFVHDANGNPTTYRGTTLTFDPENRMTAYGSVLTNGYRADGSRAWKENSTCRTYFLYDGLLPVIEMNSSGTVTATNSFGVSGIVSRKEISGVFYSLDSEGNVANRHDGTGNVISNHMFTAHGSALGGSASDPFGYKAQFGYYSDNETGLQLLSYRYYDRLSGRFLTRDPISYAGGVNVYAYARNNPTRWQDPRGTDIGGIAFGGSAFTGLGSEGSIVPTVGATGSTMYGINTADGDVGTASGYGVFGAGTGRGSAYGGTASLGVSGVYSNADSWKDLEGSFDTHIFSIGGLSVEIDFGDNGVFVIQFSPGTGIGGGWGYAHFETYTPPDSVGTVRGLGDCLGEEIENLYYRRGF